MTSVGVALVAAVVALARATSEVRKTGFGSATVFELSSVLFVLVGAVVLYFEGGGQAHAEQAVLVISAGVIVFSGVSFLVTQIRSPGKGQAVVGRWSGRPGLAVGWVFIGISWLYFALLGYIPILAGLSDLMAGVGPESVVNSRRVARDVYINPEAVYIPLQGALEIVRYMGMPMAALWGVIHFKRTGARTGLVLAFLALLTAIATGQRWPLVFAVVPFVTTGSVLVLGARRVGWKLWAGLSGALVVLSVVLGRRGMGESLTEAALLGMQDLVERVFADQMRVPVASYGINSPLLRDQEGATWLQSLSSYLPGEGASYPVDFYRIVTSDPQGFTAPPDFFTEAFINFNYLGVIIASSVYALMLTSFDAEIRKRDLPAFMQAALAVLAVSLGFASFTGIVFTLGGVIVVCLAVAVHRLFGKVFDESRDAQTKAP